MPLSLDSEKQGLAMFFKDWQAESLRYLWSIQPEGANSRAVWLNVNESLERSISRASIINYLNAMVDNGMLDYEERTGKGGHQRVYRHRYSEAGLREFLASSFIKKLLEEFPDETRKGTYLARINKIWI